VVEKEFYIKKNIKDMEFNKELTLLTTITVIFGTL
jgi:hypothetical protein